MPPMTALTIRSAGPADTTALTDLARLDSTRPLSGDVLVAEAAGRPVAALALDTGRAVSDPFVASAEAVAVLRVRATQLGAASTSASSGRARRPFLRPASG